MSNADSAAQRGDFELPTKDLEEIVVNNSASIEAFMDPSQVENESGLPCTSVWVCCLIQSHEDLMKNPIAEGNYFE